jgi:hypothetical protein
MRRFAVLLSAGLASLAVLAADQRGAKPTRRTTTAATCVADLGAGAKSARRFCDILITKPGAETVTMTIPPHTGTATLRFDLHNRFTVPLGPPNPAAHFVRQTAVIAVRRSTGEELTHVVVSSEYRSVGDLFDRITGVGPGGVKAVAPGPADSHEVTVPSTVTGIALGGVRVEVLSRDGRGTRDNDGIPVALVSNLRIEYTPR